MFNLITGHNNIVQTARRYTTKASVNRAIRTHVEKWHDVEEDGDIRWDRNLTVAIWYPRTGGHYFAAYCGCGVCRTCDARMADRR
jgi:hypothetical protein